MGRTVGAIRKIIIGTIGVPLFLLGIILIPLPGPGLLVSFLALLILSLEFEWAGSQKNKVQAKFKKIYQTAKARADKVERLGDKYDTKNKTKQ